MRKLLILGAGGYGKTVADLARQTGDYDRIGFLDDHAQGHYILGACEEFMMFSGEDVEMIPAFGNNETRLYWLDRLIASGIKVPALVHSTAYVSPTVRLKPGTVILPKAILNTDCQVGRGCIVNCGAIADHGCILEEAVHLCLGCIVKAENRIPACTKIEAGQIVDSRTYPL